MAAYSSALVREIGRAVDEGMPPADSVFFGGGTPSLLPTDLLMGVLDAIPRTVAAEVTVECNPDTVSASGFASYVAHGVNRVSFGVQSMVDHVLVALGRTHDRSNVARAVDLARAAGISNLNVDLIYGGASETRDYWHETLAAVVALQPPHVSAYALTVEAGTPLAQDRSRHPDDDDQADKYHDADNALGAVGLINYEISNWSLPGAECQHNWLYWEQGDYRGFGCAAHSHQRHRRWWNVRVPERYIELVDSGASAESTGEDLDARAAAIERLQLALRTRAGVATAAFDDQDLDEFLAAGLVRIDNDQVTLTTSGRLMANTVSIRLRG